MPVLELAFVPDVPVLVRGSVLVPVLELAFVRDMPVLVRGFFCACTKTGIRAHRASSSTGICQFYNGDWMVPVLKLAFMRSMPVLVRGSASSRTGIEWCLY